MNVTGCHKAQKIWDVIPARTGSSGRDREGLKKRESKLYTKAVYNIYKERERE